MEEVDKTIITQLRDIDCPLEEDVTSLRDLDPVQVVIAALHCLRVICPADLDSIPPNPSGVTNMATKYNVATFIANKCKDLGFRGDLGYQSFLYGSEGDVRRVFLFLMEKLPREALPTIHKEITTADRVRISGQLNKLWMPPTDEDDEQFEEIHTVNIGNVNKKSLLQEKSEADIPFHDIASLIRWNREKMIADLKSSPLRNIKIKPVISPRKPTRTGDSPTKIFEVKVDPQHLQVSVSVGEEKSPLEILLEEVNRKSDLVNEVVENIHTLESLVTQLEETLKEEQLRVLELRSQNLSLDELREMESGAKQEAEQLRQAWDEVKTSLVERLDSLKGNRSVIEEELSAIKQSIVIKRREIGEKEKLLKDLTDSIPNPFPATRNSYTKRIMEVIDKMKKLDGENAKVIQETRQLQKDIAFLTGKVQRSFNVADETVFSLAKQKDDFGKRVYKLLATMHEESDKLSTCIETLGGIKRDILKLEESVSKQVSSDVESKLNQIQSDYLEMREINKKLLQKLEGQE